MKKNTLSLAYQEYDSMQELSAQDREVLEHAIAATHSSHSPYSHFSVGAALRLEDGTIETGSNQENIAYPSGLCAERTAMFGIAARHPGVAFHTLAIAGRDAQGRLAPASPCGACRQVMAEYETLHRRPLRVIVYAQGGKIFIFEGVKNLLPFAFSM